VKKSKSLMALAVCAALGDIATASTRVSCDDEFGHGRRLLANEVNTQSSNVKGLVPTPGFSAQESVPMRAEITLASFATTDIYEMLKVPKGYQVVDWTVDVDDIDSNGSAAAVFKVGVLNAGKTDLDTGNAIWKTGLTTGQAGGVARMDTLTAIRAGSSADRVVGIIPTTASATFQAGTLGITVWVKPA
jgi:hypothetical protein